VGASGNIIEASWRALADSFEYGLVAKESAGAETSENEPADSPQTIGADAS
jgi:hypothetical protein